MQNNRVIQTFLRDIEAKTLCEKYFFQPSIEKREEIEDLFKRHFLKFQILSYFSKYLHFEAKRFDRKIRLTAKNEDFAVEKMQEILSSEASSEDICIEKIVDNSYRNIALHFTENEVFRAIEKLNDKQKCILHFLYVEDLTENEISLRLKVTQQNINKIKRNTLKKLKKELQSKGGLT